MQQLQYTVGALATVRCASGEGGCLGEAIALPGLCRCGSRGFTSCRGMLLEKMSGVDVHTSSADRDSKPNEQLEKEIGVLRRRLRDANDIVDDMARQMELQKTRTRQLIAGWKIRLQESDDKVLQCAREKDAQFTELVSELMFIEGCLKKERREIVDKLAARDSRIHQLEATVRKQQRQIDALNKANEKLLGSLHELSLESPESSPSPSPSPSYDLLDPPRENGDGAHLSNSHPNRFPNHQPEHVFRGPRQRASTVEIPPSRRNRRRGLPNGSILAQNNNSKSLDSSQLQPPQQHRVRFQDEVFHDEDDKLAEEDLDGGLPVDLRIRKISLPAYRLPTDEEDSIRFF